MPYKWVEPALAFKYFGVSIYHTYTGNKAGEENEESHIFSTARHEHFDSNVYEFDTMVLRGLGYIDEPYDRDKILMKAIEQQALPMPTNQGIDYPWKRGSFNWYLNHPHECIWRLAKAMNKGDGTNKPKMYRAFLHMGNAHQIPSWDVPHLKGEVIDKPEIRWTTRRSDHRDKDVDVERGSFFWYLHMSGGFVTHIANAILHADKRILELIRTVYPQMVAAAECDNWHESPPGFYNRYDSEVTHV